MIADTATNVVQAATHAVDQASQMNWPEAACLIVLIICFCVGFCYLIKSS